MIEEVIESTGTLEKDDNGSLVVDGFDPINYFLKVLVFLNLVVVVDSFVLTDAKG